MFSRIRFSNNLLTDSFWKQKLYALLYRQLRRTATEVCVLPVFFVLAALQLLECPVIDPKRPRKKNQKITEKGHNRNKTVTF